MAGHHEPHRRETPVTFKALTIEGGLLSVAWLGRAAQLQAGFQTGPDYRIAKGLSLRDEIGRFWRIAGAHWKEFSSGRERVADPVLISARFVQSLLRDVFGFSSLSSTLPVELAGRTYPIGFAALNGRVPVVIAPAPAIVSDSEIDTALWMFGDDGRRRSAFGVAQEYLNASADAVWGIASDGFTLRILRDNASVRRPAWIEADLRRIFTEERYSDFAALWLLAHESRFGSTDHPASECALERWRSAGREEGTRAHEHLRLGVEDAVVAFGNGFLSHPDNEALRAALKDGNLTPAGYFQELLRLAYRIIFLLTAEERGVLHGPDATDRAKALYTEGYSLCRLRERSVRRSARNRSSDLWEALNIVLRGIARGEARLGLPALGGLFDQAPCLSFNGAKLENSALLQGIFRLSWLCDAGALSRVDWRDMAPEELGSAYESLLDLAPRLSGEGRSFSFDARDDTTASARRATGSYYTPDALVQVLLDGALDPLVHATVAANPSGPAEALLKLSIVDPACGSGHFLLAAARRLAGHVASFQTDGTPSAADYRHALREVIGKCVFGVDLNPMAVELCKVSLWMEAVEPGRPLSFLDAHIQHGNSLLGATPELLKQGVPDAAWEAVEGDDDDKEIANALKKQNRQERGEFTLNVSAVSVSTEARFGAGAVDVDDATDETLASVESKGLQWVKFVASTVYAREQLVADLWCGSFVWPRKAGPLLGMAPTDAVFRAVQKDGSRVPRGLREEIGRLREQYGFFHWHLAFPHVFARGGFDLVIGNPPWIAHAGRATQPLQPHVKGFSKYVYQSFRGYPTTHGMFVERAARLLAPSGGLGLIIPSSLSELPSYEPTRSAHDMICGFTGELTDFGEGQFPGVTQPCMALVSRRCPAGREDDGHGSPWPMARPDLTEVGRSLLNSMAQLPPIPRDLFGERGFQSDDSLAEHFTEGSEPNSRFVRPLRGGSDIQEFYLGAPSFYADPVALGSRLRAQSEYHEVRVVVRNTARYPIAALSDGSAFRNSLLAVFESAEWPAHALLALLNSSFVRWIHFHRFRDARQPVMPQLKIAHLRSIPVPPCWGNVERDALADIGWRLNGRSSSPSAEEREQLDRAVFDIYRVSREAEEMVTRWHAAIHSTGHRRSRVTRRSVALSMPKDSRREPGRGGENG